MSRSVRSKSLGSLGAAALLAGLLAAPAIRGQDEASLTGEDILRKVDRTHRAHDERVIVDMVIVTEDGERERKLESMMRWSRTDDDDSHFLRFLAPGPIRGLALLTLEASDRADDQWVYLPALHKSKRIATSKRTNRFAQTDYTYEDLRTEDFRSFTYERLPDATVTNEKEAIPCFVVEAKPKAGTVSGYSKRVLYVDRARYLTLKVDYFDHQDRHAKTLTNVRHAQVDGLWRIDLATMQDHLRRSKTIWRCSKREINPGLGSGTFTVRNLERGV